MLRMWRLVVMVVVVATVVRCKHIDPDKLQALLPEPSDIPTTTTDPLDSLLSYNHTSVYNLTGIDDSIDIKTSQSEHQNGTAESEPSVSTTPKPSKDKDKKWSVPKKGVGYSKPSVVPKKGVHYASSVVGKKGADPELSTPSISARKGAEPESMIPSISARKGAEPESESPEQSIFPRKGVGMDVPMPELVSNNSSRTSEIIMDTSLENPGLSEEDMNEKGKSYSIPSPQRINPSNKHKDNPMYDVTHSYEDVDYTTTTPMEIIASGSSNNTVDQGDQTTVTSASQTTTGSVHYKPIAAMDDLDIYSDDDIDSVNYIAVILGLVLTLSFVILVVVGYRKFKDVWLRRHYASVDYLVEGMYDD